VLIGGFLLSMRSELRFPRALWLLPLTAALVWVGNAFRIASLMVVGARWSEELAYGAFHSKAGWLSFCLVTLAVAWGARRSRLLAPVAAGPDEEWEHPAAPLLVPLLAVVATSLVTGAISSQWDWLYGLRIVAGAVALWWFRGRYASPDWSWRPMAVAGALGVAVAVPWIWLGGPPAPFCERVAPVFAGTAGWVLPVWVVLRSVGSVLVVPAVEELAFRGYLLRRLVARDFDLVALSRWTPWAVVGSSLAFGLLHDRWWLASLAGLVYAFAVVRRGRLLDGVIAHATTNALVAAYVLMSGNWSLWL
jgi:exosortase E/protease (VPEID-CTERM system)